MSEKWARGIRVSRTRVPCELIVFFFFFGKKDSGRLVPEFEELEYLVRYSSPPNSGTDLYYPFLLKGFYFYCPNWPVSCEEKFANLNQVSII